MLRCQRPLAQKFRSNVLDKIEAYFTQHDVHRTFRQTFFLSTQYWLEPPAPPPVCCPSLSPCLRDQEKIGWDLLPCGFLSTSWCRLLDQLSPTDTLPPATRSLKLLSGLFKLLWTTQLQYWKEHTTSIHADATNATNATSSSSDKINEYKTRIRILHHKRSECLHGHQLQYFYDDIETFLTQATLTQMKSYLHHYEHAILQSVRTAREKPSQPIFRFPGFTYTPSQRSQPRLPNAIQRTFRNNLPSHTAKKGDQIPRKHTRWRNVLPSTNSILQFFARTPPK